VTSINERLNLYKELDNCESEESLEAFSKKLKDRFGRLPRETLDLIQTVRLRWMAKKIGFEKLTLKFGRMTGTFTGAQDSPYFQTEAFGKVLAFIQNNPNASDMKERKGKLTMRFEGVKKVEKALEILSNIIDK
jgi:transcription-repair coupling factor (superfamily II helicase)